MAAVTHDPTQPTQAIAGRHGSRTTDARRSSDAELAAVAPEILAGSLQRVLPGLGTADPQRRERRAADPRRADRDRDLLPDRGVDVPHRRQPRQPARAGIDLHHVRRGGDVRAAAVRDRPLDRLHRRRRCLRDRRADRLAGQPALVAGRSSAVCRVRAARVHPGHADHPAGLPSFVVTLGGSLGVPRAHARTGQHRQDGRRRRDQHRQQQPGRTSSCRTA